MGTLPFAASFDALAYIAKAVRLGNADPKLGEFVPVLFESSFSMSIDHATGFPVGSVPYQHFWIGWVSPQDTEDHSAVDVLGRTIYVHPVAIARLDGKQLVLRAVVPLRRSKRSATGEKVLVAVLPGDDRERTTVTSI